MDKEGQASRALRLFLFVVRPEAREPRPGLHHVPAAAAGSTGDFTTASVADALASLDKGLRSRPESFFRAGGDRDRRSKRETLLGSGSVWSNRDRLAERLSVSSMIKNNTLLIDVGNVRVRDEVLDDQRIVRLEELKKAARFGWTSQEKKGARTRSCRQAISTDYSCKSTAFVGEFAAPGERAPISSCFFPSDNLQSIDTRLSQRGQTIE